MAIMRILIMIFTSWMVFISVPLSAHGLTSSEDTTLEQANAIIQVLHDSALVEYMHGNYQKSESFFKEIIGLRHRLLPDDSIQMAAAYVNMGVMYSKNWNFNEALEYYEKAESIFNTLENSQTEIARIIINKGNIVMKMGDPLKSISYYEQSERIYKSHGILDSTIMHNIYANLAIAAIKAQLYEYALRYLDLAERYISTNKEFLKLLYHNYTRIYRDLGDFQKARLYYNYSLDIYKNEEDIYKGYFNYAYFLIFYDIDLEKGLNYVKAGLEYYEKNKVNSPLFKAYALQITGNYYEKKDDLDKALSYYQQAIILVSDDFHDMDISANPVSVSNTYDGRILIYLKDKARVLLKYYEKNPDTRYLEHALNSSLKAIEIINRMRFRYTSEASNFLISEKEKYTFDFTEKVAYLLYSITGNTSYLNQGFTVNEQGRAFSLLSSIRKQRATEYGGIPDIILAEEKDLNRRLSLYEELIFQEKQSVSPDTGKISAWKTSLFEVEQNYEKFVKRLEKEFPNYYSLKYDQHITNPEEIRQKIGQNTALLEYSILDSLLLIYYTNKEKTDVISVHLEPGFENKCDEFSSLITKQSFSDDVRDTYKKYKKLGYELYRILIEPVEDEISAENLIIIPDGAISYIPFDALLTQNVIPDKLDYPNLPFLIRKYSAGYSYSATFHFNPIRHIRIQNQSLLAFAPSYSNLMTGIDDSEAFREPDLSRLLTLPGVKDEVKKISRIIDAEVYMDEEATEKNFKTFADRYRILHLAMHTLIDDENPMFSKLAFTYQTADTTEDNFLHTYEIYNMKFNASLAVLSSCSSGYGKIQEGEGIQSLARAFAYAGCPTILMTLWEVADLSTVLMMDKFYTYLKDHDPVPVALRKAKLDFLMNADLLNANPFFWSSYVIIGDSNPIFPLNRGILFINVLLLILPLCYLGFIYKKYSGKQ